jgi:hypothetical protein
MTHDDDTCPHLVRANLLDAENARLKAEVERLKAFTTRTIIPNEELQAQVERLTKAGDAVCESPYLWETDPAVIAWRAAKDGKSQP